MSERVNLYRLSMRAPEACRTLANSAAGAAHLLVCRETGNYCGNDAAAGRMCLCPPCRAFDVVQRNLEAYAEGVAP